MTRVQAVRSARPDHQTRVMSDQYQGLYHSFQWLVPTQFNIAEMCCYQWASNPSDARRIALHCEDESGSRDIWSYGRLAQAANQLANGLVRMGLGAGDRLAIILGQRAETVVAHMAAYAIGAITVPLPTRISPDVLTDRLLDAEPRAAIVDMASGEETLSALDRAPSVQQIVSIDFADERTIPWRSLLARQPSEFRRTTTKASDPALLLYTAGTTSTPKGVLLSHAALIGNLPGFVSTQDWFPQPDDIFWSPADWSSSIGLMAALLPTLYFGMPVVATNQRHTPESALAVMERYAVTNALLSPTDINAMMKAVPQPRSHHQLALRSLAISGAPLGKALFTWCQDALGITPNETYSQAEASLVVGNCQARWPSKPGSMGRPIPGHNVAILDDDGLPLSVVEIGELAVSRHDIHGMPDPVLFLGYWRDDATTQARHHGHWYRTGDLAWRDQDGDLWHAGRSSDVFWAGGPRIDPAQLEIQLQAHPAISNVAVVPIAGRKNAVHVYFVAAPLATQDDAVDALANEIRPLLQSQLGLDDGAILITRLDSLPITVTGQIQRRLLSQLAASGIHY